MHKHFKTDGWMSFFNPILLLAVLGLLAGGAFASDGSPEGQGSQPLSVPVGQLDPESLAFSVPVNNQYTELLRIKNTGSGVLGWTLQLDGGDAPGEAQQLQAHNPDYDEEFILPAFTLPGSVAPDPVEFVFAGGIGSQGKVVGFSFEGDVSGVAGFSWASDTCLVLEAPDGSRYGVGGYPGVGMLECGEHLWDFDGPGSSSDGHYQSTHDDAFESQPQDDDGLWTLRFINGWTDPLAATLTWNNAKLILHKEPLPSCEDNPVAPGWLSVSPDYGNTGANQLTNVLVSVDSTGLAAGTYFGQICVDYAAPGEAEDGTGSAIVPVKLTVTDENAVQLSGRVGSMGYCDLDTEGSAHPVAGALISVAGQNGFVASTTTNAAGQYALSINQAHAPLDITVSAPGHVSHIKQGVNLNPWTGTVEDFAVRLEAACARVEPLRLEFSADVGGSAQSQALYLTNEGAEAYAWNLTEAPILSSQAHFPQRSYRPLHADPAQSSLGPDPRQAEAGRAAAPLALSPGDLDVPAYSTTSYTSPGYVLLDATRPHSHMQVISANQATFVDAAAFIGNDFSSHYMLASSGGLWPLHTFGYTHVETGEYRDIGTVDGTHLPSRWSSMSWDHHSGRLYAVGQYAGQSYLYSINPHPDILEAVRIGRITGSGVHPAAMVAAIALSPDGLMYGLDIVDDVLLAINKDTGAATVIGPLGHDANYAQDMDFNPEDGTLYWAGYFADGDSRLMTINLASGAASQVGLVTSGAELLSFSIALPGAGGCDNPAAISWLSYNQSSGTVAADGMMMVQVWVNPSSLQPGTYLANLCFNITGDDHRPLMIVPVELEVVDPTPPDPMIFKDRFEAVVP